MQKAAQQFMAYRQQDSVTALTAVTGVAGLLFGVIVGYVVGVSQSPAGSVHVAAAPSAASAPAALASEAEMQAYHNILASDPTNVRANIELANRLYDASRYAEAIPHYQRGLAGDAKNVSVSTDLATALFYAGRADEALAQLDRSLAIDPKHRQTMFNVGIVKRDGKQDPKGAIAAWEKLLAAAPDYPDAGKVRTMITELRTKAS